jgi:hypothetical protein
MHDLIMSKAVARIALSLMAAGAVLASGTPASAQPLFPNEFSDKVATQGFGDRQNSQPWAMTWWNGKLYVGTGRASYCVQQATAQLYYPDRRFYPTREKDIACTKDARDLPLQAEIWQWTPPTTDPPGPGTWKRVYQAPNDVPIQGTDPQKYTARDIGYRGMLGFTEADGTQALYVSGDSTRGGLPGGVGFDGPVPPPRILRSTDGENFKEVPFNPDVTLGSPIIAGFRSLKSYKGKLYVVGSIGQLGHGIILESAHPELGEFRQIGPTGKTFFEIETYNGFLWAGTGVNPSQDSTPFSLLKTDATGEPYTFTPVIPPGAFAKKPSSTVISLNAFNGRLYVGTDRELLRVNPDDTWDLVVGVSRKAPDGRLIQALSGFDNGFDNAFNIHMWRLGSYLPPGGRIPYLYVGTQDQSTKWRAFKPLAPGLGFDLYATADGWHYTAVTLTGLGDPFNSGLRNFAATTSGFFMGSHNPYQGTKIYLGKHVPNPAACASGNDCQPLRLETEFLGKVAVLSWEGAPGATKFHVFRSSGFGAPVEIGAAPPLSPLPLTGGGVYVDQTIKPFVSYHYYVVGEDAQASLTGPSNTVRVPFHGPVPTFKSLADQLARWSAPATISGLLSAAQTAVQVGTNGQPDYPTALGKLQAIGALITPPNQPMAYPYQAQDLGVLLAKFTRRVLLAQAKALPPSRLIR